MSRNDCVEQCNLILNILLMATGLATSITGIYARFNLVLHSSPVCTAMICSGIAFLVFSYFGSRVARSSNCRLVVLYIFVLLIILGANIYGLNQLYDLPKMTKIPFERCQDLYLLNADECYDKAMTYHFFMIAKYVCFGLIFYEVMYMALLTHHAIESMSDNGL